MWLEYSFAVAAFALLLFFPGYLAFRCFGAGRSISLLSAPAISITLYCLLGLAYDVLGVQASALLVAGLPICFLTCARGLLYCLKDHSRALVSVQPNARFNWKYGALYISIGMLAGLIIYVKSLNGAYSFVPSYDNLFHYNAIRALEDSGCWTSLNVSCYLDFPEFANPMPGGTYPSDGYYPMGWHVLVVLLMNVSGCGEMLAINAANYIFASLVFPLGMYQLIATIFPKRNVIVAGALCSSAFAIFPWHLLIEWPLFPNLAAFCLLPALMSWFILALESVAALLSGEAPEAKVQAGCYLAAFLVSCVACGFIHPNSIFTAALLLAPFLVWIVGRTTALRYGTAKGFAVSVAVCLGIVALWLALYHTPAFSRAVDVLIGSRQSPSEAQSGLLTLSFTNEIGQPILSFFVIGGFFMLVHKRHNLWLLATFSLAAWVYYVSACAEEGLFKQILTGFWYTESKRTGCIVAIAAMPIAAYGIASLYASFTRLIKEYTTVDVYRKASRLIGIASGCFLVAILLIAPVVQGKNGTATALGNMVLQAEENYTSPLYSQEEVAFVESALSVVGEDGLVINLPYDGSIIAYGVNGMKVFYLERYGYEPPLESQESVIIRTRLCNIANDSSVAEAVKSIGAEYVLILECADQEVIYGFEEDQWVGISSISDNTPGFTAVLSKGNMRLYQIDATS